MTDRIDTRYQPAPVCPHCGHQHRDAFEWSDESERECEECGKAFHCSRDIEVTYSTHKAQESSDAAK